VIVSSEGSRLRFVRRRIRKKIGMASARHEKSIPSDACEAVQSGRYFPGRRSVHSRAPKTGRSKKMRRLFRAEI
jgi:hypothetical protein